MTNIEQIQYPIGKWASKDHYSPEEIEQNRSDLLAYKYPFENSLCYFY